MPRTDWSLYTTRYWQCAGCNRIGFILQHRHDTPLKALDKRLQSHGLRQRHCTGQQLKWMTAEEEQIARLTHKGGHHLPHG